MFTQLECVVAVMYITIIPFLPIIFFFRTIHSAVCIPREPCIKKHNFFLCLSISSSSSLLFILNIIFRRKRKKNHADQLQVTGCTLRLVKRRAFYSFYFNCCLLLLTGYNELLNYPTNAFMNQILTFFSFFFVRFLIFFYSSEVL